MGKHIQDTNLQFIREKIYQLRNAIMYSMSNELIRIPNTIVTAIRIDEEGHLWFTCKAPANYVNEYEQSFPARLHFFKKGLLYYMEVSGKATIIKNFEKIPDYPEQSLLIRMNISNAEYAEPQVRNKTRLDVLMENIYSWFMRTVSFPRTTKPTLAKLHQTNNS